MSGKTYLDFDLLIERAGDAAYRARVLRCPTGEDATLDFRLPFSAQDLELFRLRIERSRGEPTRDARRQAQSGETVKEFGGRLFDAVFDRGLGECLRSNLRTANAQGARLRLRLRLTGAPELADLPWEYLYNPDRDHFFALSERTPLVRYLELPEPVRALAVTPPLRVLVLIASPQDYPRLDVEREWANLQRALDDLLRAGRVVLERLDVATLGQLQRRLWRGQYHVFHFIGHGGFDDREGEGLLVLEDEHERGHRVSSQRIGQLLYDHDPLRLAVLNACEGARSSHSDPFAGMAQRLVQQGVPAVIAMQSEITDRAAIVFAHEFYQAVANGHPVDAALTATRQIINAEVNDVEWGAPVLYMRAPDGRIFDIQGGADAAQAPPAPDTAALREAALAVMAREGWDEAIATWGRLLEIDPGDAEARARLDESRRQRELAALYASARQHLDAGRWHAALDDLRHLRADGGAYRDVVALIAAAEGQIARLQELDRLYRRGQERANAGRWPEALSDFGRVRAMDGDYKEVNALIAIAERELAKARELEGYYSRGLAHFGAGRWQPALDDFTRVQALGGDYKGVRAYAATAERELAGLAANAGRRVPLLTRFKLLSTGGVIALGALLTLCCGLAILAAAANHSATPTPAPLNQHGTAGGLTFVIHGVENTADARWQGQVMVTICGRIFGPLPITEDITISDCSAGSQAYTIRGSGTAATRTGTFPLTIVGQDQITVRQNQDFALVLDARTPNQTIARLIPR